MNAMMLWYFMTMMKEHTQPRAPENTHIYAIGDVHGKASLLLQLCDKIYDDAQKHENNVKIIFLGDLIDRGEDSRGVIEIILSLIDAGIDVTPIIGNHEYYLLKFLKNSQDHRDWMMWGGSETLKSYGVIFTKPDNTPYNFDELAQQLKANIPQTHMDFYNSMPHYHEAGDYFFSHAGLRPNLALSEQTVDDLTRIRRDFLQHPVTHDKTIVFGHTIFDDPLQEPGKIGVDTGAFRSNILTAVVLHDDKRYFLQTGTS